MSGPPPGAKTRRAVHPSGQKTRRAVHSEVAGKRDAKSTPQGGSAEAVGVEPALGERRGTQKPPILKQGPLGDFRDALRWLEIHHHLAADGFLDPDRVGSEKVDVSLSSVR
jgi:hypothetical protein